MPKNPPPRNLFAQETAQDETPRELSSPKKRLRDRPTGQEVVTSASDAKHVESSERPWQHKALFAPQSASAKTKAAAAPGKFADVGQQSSNAASSLAGIVGAVRETGVAAESGVAESVADKVKRFESVPKEKGTPKGKDTPVSVKHRIRQIEGTKSSPNLFQADAGRPASNGPSAAQLGTSATSVKPKELFRNPVESAFRAAQGGTAPSAASTSAAAMEISSGPTNMTSSQKVHTEAASSSQALGEPHRGAVLATSKSSGHVGMAPTQSKESDHKKSAPSSFSQSAEKASTSMRSPVVERQRSDHSNEMVGTVASTSQAKAESASASMPKKKAQRRSACFVEEETPASSAGGPEAPESLASAAAEGTTLPPANSTPLAGTSAKKDLPAVPVFQEPPRVEDCMTLRRIALSEKLAEDNYEISEHGASDDEDAQARDRGRKHVPKWCENYLETLNKQSDVDPDTIFGSKVPKCALEDIFDDAMYRQVGKNRPKRVRGSSGDWRKDKLTRNEIQSYKTRMGHARTWKEISASAS
jgi:hypothetical protein